MIVEVVVGFHAVDAPVVVEAVGVDEHGVKRPRDGGADQVDGSEGEVGLLVPCDADKGTCHSRCVLIAILGKVACTECKDGEWLFAKTGVVGGSETSAVVVVFRWNVEHLCADGADL